MKILILGANGFIGSNLSEAILSRTDWEIYGMDLAADKLGPLASHKRMHFTQGNVKEQRAWIEEQVKKCDAVLPLVAIARPAAYTAQPIEVFELAFESNLQVVRDCLKHGKRVIFPSTSEVYGMCEDESFDEETSNLVLGPVSKLRWIYSCSKQMLDRVIYAYGEKEGLNYTIFRPFNWIGPKLDNVWDAKEGNSRALSQFIGNVLRGEPIKLVNGGSQRRCFLYIDDAVDALLRILENKEGNANQRIFNLGSPENDHTMREIAEMVVRLIGEYEGYEEIARSASIVDVTSADYYGSGYQDAARRKPSVKNAMQQLGWKPVTDTQTAIRKTLDYYLLQEAPARNAAAAAGTQAM